MSKPLEIGVHLMTYGATWDEVVALAKEVDRLGYDFLLMHDHLLATQGDLHQPFFEAYTTLASFAHVTSTVKLGLMTGNNPLRNPGVVSKMVITLDHMSKGRMTLCLGAGSLPVEFPPHGLGNESVGQRLDAVDDALTIVRGLLAGEEVTLKSDHYDFDRVRHAPRPVQDRVPVIVGASGEKKGLRIVAKHADYWQMSVGPESADEYRHKNEVLVQHCESVGRDPGAIRRMPSGNFILRKHESEVAPALADMAKPFRWSPEVHAEMASTTWGGPSERVVEQLQPMKATGLDGLILMALPPFDYESIERFAREVRPALEA